MDADELRFFEAAVGLRTRRDRRAVPRSTRREIISMVRQQDDELRRGIIDDHRAAGIEGFREAVCEGVLEIHTFRQTSVEAIVQAHIKGEGGWSRRRHRRCDRRVPKYLKDTIGQCHHHVTSN